MAQLQRITIAPDQIQDKTVLLTAEQQHYLRRVLRLRDGDRFIANTPSCPWLAALTATGMAPLLQALPTTPSLPVHIHLLAALPKTGFDDVVRQSTELGVGTIWPILSDRTLLKPSPQKLMRWKRIAQEATEQCERAEIPVIHPPLPWGKALAQVQADRYYLCAARGEAASLSAVLPPPVSTGSSPNLAIAIGPEGGWTEAEIQEAMTWDYVTVSLGPTILRAVTAPLAAIAQVMAKYDHLN